MPEKNEPLSPVSRREFLKGMGTSAVAAASAGTHRLARELEKVNQEKVVGPGAVALNLNVNGQSMAAEAAPNATLLDVLRTQLDHTGAKEVCGKATCGACTVLMDGRPVYSCMKLAIEAQGAEISTVEGLADGDALSELQDAFIAEDGLMCGFCTSGFVMTLTALLSENPEPTEDDVRHACEGHLCRCGTYPRVVKSALRAAGVPSQSSTEVIHWSHGEKLA